jgi:hypothetical protein
MLAAVFAFAALPLLAGARARSASINVVNNSGREIVNLYLSHPDADDWGSDLLPDSTIKTGESFTITNVTCDQSQIKVVAEDKDGCFLSTVVACGDAVTWTITNDTAADCGGH